MVEPMENPNVTIVGTGCDVAFNTIDEAKVTSNANAMVAYSKAMAAMGAADGISGIGSAVGAFGGTIAGLFGAETDPLAQLEDFQKYNFDAVYDNN